MNVASEFCASCKLAERVFCQMFFDTKSFLLSFISLPGKTNTSPETFEFLAGNHPTQLSTGDWNPLKFQSTIFYLRCFQF